MVETKGYLIESYTKPQYDDVSFVERNIYENKRIYE